MLNYKWAIIIVLFIILIFSILSHEGFISFTANLSEYGPQPLIIMTKYKIIVDDPAYTELNSNLQRLTVLEIYNNQTFKIYGEPEVYEGIVPGYLVPHIDDAINLSPYYNGKRYCQTTVPNPRLNLYKAWVNGYDIDMGTAFGCCFPADLNCLKQISRLLN